MKRSRAPLPLTFSAHVIKGAGRGRTIGSPTLNLRLSDLPQNLREGIYACHTQWNRRTFPAAMHFGKRPAFFDSLACEIHVIGHPVRRAPRRLTVEVVQRLRGIRNFSSVAALQRQIARDIEKTQKILSVQRNVLQQTTNRNRNKQNIGNAPMWRR